MHFKTEILFTNNYNKIIKKAEYEYIVMQIINRSKVVFKDLNPFTQIFSQSDGERDLQSTINPKYFLELKILLSSDFCEQISSNTISSKELMNLSQYFSDYIQNTNNDVLSEYSKEFIKYITAIRKKIINELSKSDVLVFYPLPTIKLNSLFANLLTCSIESWLFDIRRESSNKIFFLTITQSNQIFLSSSDHKIEIIDYPLIKTYIKTIEFEQIKD